jgi:flavin-dependent dehydrogenase
MMAFDATIGPAGSVDVVICGGGFAGLTLALQLRREHPDVSVAVIDRLERPLPEAAFKVGESTVELAAFYLRDMLGLTEYLDKAHLRKMGLRFFFQSKTGKFVDRPEYGLSKFATIPTYQIDRGRLENDLRAMLEADGVQMIEGARIDALVLGENGAAHEVRYYQGNEGSEVKSLTARWLVDSSGRSRMLQRQLGLSKQREADHHAVWFRVEGKLDVEDLVPDSETEWHDRVPGRKRFHATVHLVNKGYWVWIIPLASGHTSVGIVATKTYHPLEGFKSRDKAMEFLHKNEPELAALMAKHPMMDFGVIRNYSHTSGQVFSGDRWACTGDAGVFSDPMYSPGADLIAFANTSISWMVGEDMQGRLTHQMAEDKSKFVISIGELLTRSIQVNYHLLGAPETMAAKLFWDITAGWAVVQPLMFGKVFLDAEKHSAVRAASRQFFFMSLQMNTLFTEWAAKSKGNISYDFIDYFAVDPIREMRTRNLIADKPLAELVADQKMNMDLMEELAIALFRLAVADVLPEHYHRVENTWINAWSVSLDPSKWEERGLFTPRTAPRDLSHLTEPLNRMFRVRVLQD